MANVQLAVAGDDTTQVILSVPGVQGPAGSNLPPSGTTHQLLYKQSSTDYDTAWKLITDDNVDAAAAIAGTKISPNFGSQNVLTTGTDTAASFIPTSSSAPTNGLYLPGTNQVALSTNGTPRVQFGTSEVVFNDDGNNYDFRIEGDTVSNLFFVDASADAVGIGTTSPNVPLHISSSSDGTIASFIRLENPNSSPGTGGSILFTAATTKTQAVIAGGCQSNDENGYLSFQVRTSASVGEKARIDSSGTFRVKGAGTAGVNDAVQLNGSAPANSLLLDASGRLLVGTSSDISGGIAGEITQIVSSAGGGIDLGRNDSTVTVDELVGVINFYSSAGGSWQKSASIKCEADAAQGDDDKPGRLVFSTTADGASSPTERMRINNVGGFDSYAAGSAFRVRNAGSSPTSAGFQFYKSATSTTNGTVCMVIQQDGDLENTNNSYGAISDIKLKENIVNANSQWNDLKSLQVRNYNFKPETGHSTHTQIGLIAQEVELVSPGLVGESIDEETGESTKSVNYSVLYMKAVKALQEAMERIEQLETEMAEVKAQLA